MGDEGVARSGADNGRLHLRAGTAAAGPWALEVAPGRPGWAHTSLRVLELAPGGSHAFDTGPEEMLVLPLTGAAAVDVDGAEFALAGRAGVFDAVGDFAYAPRDSRVRVHSPGGGRFAVAGAPCSRRLPARYGPAAGVAVEVRGAGHATRQVNNICTPATFEADRLLVVEVLTPGGNWSSYPPHKHDEAGPDETELEEIYYFALARPGFAFHRVYGTAARPVDVLAEVGDGDVVLIPHGWHGPSTTAPGIDLYYLNVMAGPGPERAWRICDDPAHAWVRGTWSGVAPDPRVPMTSASGRVGPWASS
jgi:5-deoxy-glucuronate isomerase